MARGSDEAGAVPQPDGGCAAWIRVVAYAFVCFGTLGLQYSFGPLYALLLEELGLPPAPTAFVGSLCAGVMDGCGAVSGVIVERFGYRRVCVIGAMLSFVGMLLSAAATELWQLYLAYGVVVGLGCSLSLMSPIALMNTWFSSRLSLSHALGNMGSALLPLFVGPASQPLFASVGRQVSFRGLPQPSTAFHGLRRPSTAFHSSHHSLPLLCSGP